MHEIRTILSADRHRRVVFFRNADDSVGFREERWSADPLELCWVPEIWPDSHSDCLEIAIREATGRVPWLAAANST